MNLAGLYAAIAATGDALNATEARAAELTAANQHLLARVEELQAAAAALNEPQEPQPPSGEAIPGADPPATPVAP